MANPLVKFLNICFESKSSKKSGTLLKKNDLTYHHTMAAQRDDLQLIDVSVIVMVVFLKCPKTRVHHMHKFDHLKNHC